VQDLLDDVLPGGVPQKPVDPSSLGLLDFLMGS
jgi:hypothetical protein